MLVTHDSSRPARLAEWVVRIDEGRVVEARARPRRCCARDASIDVSLGEVAAALVLVAIAIVASRWRDAGLEEDIAVAVARSFVQLVAIGYVIDVIFEQDNAGLVIALLAVMVVFGALTARRPGRQGARTRSGRCWSRCRWRP